MATWPTNMRTPNKVDEQIVKNQIRSDFEAGYVQSRSKWTKSRKKFTLNWSNGITLSEKVILEGFFNNNLGKNFDWINPMDNNTYTVLFSDDNIQFNSEGSSVYTCTVTLEEQ